MELVNATKLPAEYTVATDKTGREWLVAVAKGTYGIPDSPGGMPALLAEQVPPVMTDVFSGEPGFSAPLYENDFALHKPRCDVLLNGSCHAPDGKPATLVPVGLRVGAMTKSFNVVGNRHWRSQLLSVSASAPEAFAVMPISYDNAYGGVHAPEEDPATHRWYLPNHVGRGFHPGTSARQLNGRPLPNTEEIAQPVSEPDGRYRPMAFGPMARSWPQRLEWAGTYDDKWRAETFPFLPADFDDRYFQSAPEDQQVDYLRGGEQVVLVHLSPRARIEFELPALRIPFDFVYKDGRRSRMAGVVDTLVIEPDLGRFMLTVRAAQALRRSLHELVCVEVGGVLPQRPNADGEEPEVVAKPHYRSLAELVRERRKS